jgi:dienelactone hydrolase
MKRIAFSGFAALLLSSTAMAGEAVVYEVDGANYEGYFAPAEGDSKGLVLIVHDWDGLDSYETGRADMLAGMGYDAFALDLFGQGNRPETMEGRREATGALNSDREKMRSLLMGGLQAARAQSDQETVVMGYCFGGGAVLEMARSGEADRIAGYATFHGGLSTPDGQSYPEDTPPLLIAHGGADTSITMEDVAALSQELEEKGITYEIEVYSGAPHAFTVIGSDRYQERADMKSWAAFDKFLQTHLGS